MFIVLQFGSSGVLCFGIFGVGVNDVQVVVVLWVMLIWCWVYVIVMLQGNICCFYVDGIEVGKIDDMLLLLWQVGDQVIFLGCNWVYLLFNGCIQGLCVQVGVLSVVEVVVLVK